MSVTISNLPAMHACVGHINQHFKVLLIRMRTYVCRIVKSVGCTRKWTNYIDEPNVSFLR